MSKKDDAAAPLDSEGRMHDGWSFAVDLVGGGSVRLADHDDLRAVWARIRAAQAEKPPGDVFFSGARAAESIVLPDREEPTIRVGKLDGAGVLSSSSILMLRGWGSSVTGVSEIRLAAIEEGLRAAISEVEEIGGDVEAMDAELHGRVPGWVGVMEEEGSDEPPAPPPAGNLTVMPAGAPIPAGTTAEEEANG